MAEMARWRDRTWEVSAARIAPLDSIATARTLKKDANEDRDGGNPSNVRGYEPQGLSLAYTADTAAGGDPAGEFAAWKALVGETGPFLLGGRRFGPPLYQLERVSLEGPEFDGFGRMRRASISLSFIQDRGEEDPAGGQGAPGLRGGPPGPASGLGVGPSGRAIARKLGRDGGRT